jgi:hypothetical protein
VTTLAARTAARSQFAGQQPVWGDEPRSLEVYAPAQNPLFGVLGVESEHNMSRPPGVSGQPPPAHRPLESPESAQLQLTVKSTHQRSPVKLDELQAPCSPQSASFKHGSQLLPLPVQLPKRC